MRQIIIIITIMIFVAGSQADDSDFTACANQITAKHSDASKPEELSAEELVFHL
jgi:hypothetical protein